MINKYEIAMFLKNFIFAIKPFIFLFFCTLVCFYALFMYLIVIISLDYLM